MLAWWQIAILLVLVIIVLINVIKKCRTKNAARSDDSEEIYPEQESNPLDTPIYTIIDGNFYLVDDNYGSNILPRHSGSYRIDMAYQRSSNLTPPPYDPPPSYTEACVLANTESRT